MTDSVSRILIVGGGNSRFTAGAFRCVYSGLEDLLKLMPDLSENEIATTDFGTYSDDQYLDDMFRVTNYRSDPDLVECLVRQSAQTMLWMRDISVRFMPIYGRQAFKVEGKFTFWGGRAVREDRGYFRGARSAPRTRCEYCPARGYRGQLPQATLRPEDRRCVGIRCCS